MLLVATVVSALSASVYAATMRRTRRALPREPIAFGAHMMLGYVLAALFGVS